MAQLTDPSSALQSLQEAFLARSLHPLQKGALHPEVLLFVDTPNDKVRFSYFTHEQFTVTGLAMLAQVEPLKGCHCFHLGVAVPPSCRNQGRGKALVLAAIEEFIHGFAKIGAPTYYIDAVVGLDNTASQRIAAAALSPDPADIIDSVSGLTALHYLKRVDP